MPGTATSWRATGPLTRLTAELLLTTQETRQPGTARSARRRTWKCSAVCWLTLGRPGLAVTALETAARSLPPAYRRDRGAALSRQAAAYAALGEPAEAARAAMGALDIARAAGSGRVLKMTTAVADGLASYAHIDAVAGLRAAVATIPAV
jgi:hypothetical protein